MNNIKIKRQIVADKQDSGYYVVMQFMYGDDDGNVEREFGPFYEEDENALLNLAFVLDNQIETLGDISVSESFKQVKGLAQWFNDGEVRFKDELIDTYGDEIIPAISEEFYQIENISEILTRVYPEWQMNPDGYGDYASLTGYRVIYVDDFGERFDTEFL